MSVPLRHLVVCLLLQVLSVEHFEDEDQVTRRLTDLTSSRGTQRGSFPGYVKNESDLH